MLYYLNFDTQPVSNHYKAVTYMYYTYFSKSEGETSEQMKQVVTGGWVFNSNKTNIEQMRSIGRAYTTERECSVQEAAYLLMP